MSEGFVEIAVIVSCCLDLISYSWFSYLARLFAGALCWSLNRFAGWLTSGF